MRKRVIVSVIFLGLMLCGCEGGGDSESRRETGTDAGITEDGAKTASGVVEAEGETGIRSEAGSGGEGSEAAVGNGSGGGASESGDPESGSKTVDGESDGKAGETGTVAVQGGPFGEISIEVPAGWEYEALPMDSEELISGKYGFHFYPEGAAEGYIELGYREFFGVCGTGLEQQSAIIAGSPANIGIYDGHDYWDFVCFEEQNEGVVALAYSVEGWWSEYGNQVLEILDTLSFDRSVKEGGAYIYHEESNSDDIGLYFFLQNISSTGVTLCYQLYEPDAPTGQLLDGDYFVIEQFKDGKWENAPIVVEGDYGFHDIAYTISADETTERELNWEWLYGELAPGEYRIAKNIHDFRKSGDFDQYTLYAYFILN